MQNESISSAFPSTRQDISNLSKTATDAAKDLKSTASVHAEKAKGQFKELANHAQQEGSEQLEQAKGKLVDVANTTRDYFAARPLASVGVALAVGFLIGTFRSSCSRA